MSIKDRQNLLNKLDSRLPIKSFEELRDNRLSEKLREQLLMEPRQLPMKL